MLNYGQQQPQQQMQQQSQKNLQYQSLQNNQYQQIQLHQQLDLENDKNSREDYLGSVNMVSNYEGIYDLEEDPCIGTMGKYGNLGVHKNNNNSNNNIDEKRIMNINFSGSTTNINSSTINTSNSNNINNNNSNNGSSNSNPGNSNSINNNNSSNQVPFRAGDWKCKTEGCNYHNFAKNTNCLRCGAVREMPRRSASTNSYSYKQRRTLSGLPDQLPSIPDGSKQQLLQQQQQKKLMMRSLSLHHQHPISHFTNGGGVPSSGRNAGINSLVNNFGNFTVEEH